MPRLLPDTKEILLSSKRGLAHCHMVMLETIPARATPLQRGFSEDTCKEVENHPIIHHLLLWYSSDTTYAKSRQHQRGQIMREALYHHNRRERPNLQASWPHPHTESTERGRSSSESETPPHRPWPFSHLLQIRDMLQQQTETLTWELDINSIFNCRRGCHT